MGIQRTTNPFWLLAGLTFFAVWAPRGAVAADRPVDVSKLKKGDRLEVRVGADWVPAEFVEKISDKMIRVKRQDFPVPVGAIVAFTRLPAKRAKATAARDADDPFATKDEKALSGAMRSWSDVTGKFKVQAQLLRIEGDQVVLRRDDDKELTVAIEKFTDADKKYIADVRNGKIKLAADGGGTESTNQAASEGVARLTATDLNQASAISISGAEPWSYRPDQRAQRDVLKPTRVKLEGAADFFDKPERLLLMPNEKKAFVVVVNTHPGRGGHSCQLQSCDLASGKSQSGMLTPEFAPLDISPDGASLLARTEWPEPGKQTELRIYRRDGGSAKLVAAWLPYSHHASASSRLQAKSEEDSSERPKLDASADVMWAAYVDSSNVLTISRDGELAMWETPKLKPVYMVKGQQTTLPALSANREYVALATAAGAAILQTADGRVAGVLPGKDISNGAFAFRDDGKRLAMRQGDRLTVWNLENHELVRDFPLQAADGWASPIAWTDNEHILTGTRLVDVERRISIWTYRQLGPAWAVRDGILWFVSKGVGRNDTVLASAEATPKAALEAARHLNPDEMLAVKPGVEVAVDLPSAGTADGESIRAGILQKLQDAGIKVVPQSNIRLVGSIQPGKTVQIQYRPFGSPKPLPFSATEQVLTLSWLLNNQPIWKHERRTSPPFFLHLTQGQTIDQALQKAMQIDVKTFGGLWLPVYVARPNPELTQRNASDTPAG